MAAYKTEQINVGSIAAPDIGKALTDYASMVNANYQQGLSNTRNAIADQRAKELFDRQTNEYNREVGLRKAKQDITRDFMNNQSAYGGQPLHDRLNDAVNAEAQRRLTSTPEIGELDALVARQNKGETLTPQELVRKDEIAKKITFSPEEASGIQKESESIVPFQEDAKAMLAAKYAAAGIDNAHALATDATSGLVSRATIQERMDKNREIAQQWNDKVAQANLEAYKLNNQNAVTNAKEQNDINRSLISSGTGGGAGGGSGSYKGGGLLPYTATSQDLYNHIKGMNISPSWLYANDEREALKLADSYNKFTPQQLAYALDNSISGYNDRSIDQNRFTEFLNNMTPGQMVSSNPYGTGIRTATQVTGQVDPKDLLSSFVPRDIAGYDTKDMDARIAKNLPFLHAGQPEVPTNGVVERTIVNKSSKGQGDTLADKNNNYGNIKYNKGTNWEGGSEGQSGFVRFETPELGFRALAKNLNNGAVGHSIEEYMNKYAPKSENDTDAYIKQVSKALGKTSNENITAGDIPVLMRAIAKQEGGKNYTEAQIDAGYQMAMKPNKFLNNVANTRSEMLHTEMGKPSVLTQSSSDILRQIEEVNKKTNTGSFDSPDAAAKIAQLTSLNNQYAEAKKIEDAKKYLKPEEMNWVQRGVTGLFGNQIERKNRPSIPVPEENASVQEKGLEDQSLNMLLAARGLGIKGTPTEVLQAPGKSVQAIKNYINSSRTPEPNEALMREIFDTTPLATHGTRSSIIGGRTATETQELINKATMLRNKPSLTAKEEDELAMLMDILKPNKSSIRRTSTSF